MVLIYILLIPFYLWLVDQVDKLRIHWIGKLLVYWLSILIGINILLA